jgi:hypothetical protein
MLMAAVLTIFCLTLASAKTYDISLTSPAKVGDVQLKAGEYRMQVAGNKATFTDVATLKTYTTEIKIENSDTKFDGTKVNTTMDGATAVVKDIEIGGSKIRIDF